MSAADIALDIVEAKKLLGLASRKALKTTLAAFIRDATGRELDLLSGGGDDDAAASPTEKILATPSVAPPAVVKAPPAVAPPAAPKAPPAYDAVVAPAPAPRAPAPVIDAAVASPPPPKIPATKTVVASAGKWSPLMNYGWEQGEYNSQWVNVITTVEDVGTVKDTVECSFTNESFDLRIPNLNGVSYRLLVDTLDKDIVPEESRIVVKKNKVTVKLKKVKGEFSYDNWQDLKKKGGRAAKEKDKNKDPSAGIMDMMKNLYDDGDDNMRKIIGESMMKSQRGEKVDPKIPGDDDFSPPSPSMESFDADDEFNEDEDLPPMPSMPDLSKMMDKM